MVLALTALLAFSVTPDDAAAASALATRSQEELGRQELAQALEDIHKAYDLDPRPELLFQVGQCERAIGHWRRARSAFQRYLAELPDGPSSGDATQLAAELEHAPPEAPEVPASPTPPAPQATNVAAPVAPAAPAATPAAELPPEPSHPLAWALAAGGVAALAVAAIGAAQVSSYDSTVSNINLSPPGTYSSGSVTPAERSAQLWQPLAIVFAVVGVAALGGAVLTW